MMDLPSADFILSFVGVFGALDAFFGQNSCPLDSINTLFVLPTQRPPRATIPSCGNTVCGRVIDGPLTDTLKTLPSPKEDVRYFLFTSKREHQREKQRTEPVPSQTQPHERIKQHSLQSQAQQATLQYGIPFVETDRSDTSHIF